jgi:hypothetical protein
MKIDISNIPRAELYLIYQTQPLNLSEKEIALSFERSRFDARLFEIVTEHIRDFWWTIDPVYLNQACKKMKSPFVIKCIISAILDYCKITINNKYAFQNWSQLACRGIKKPAPQLFIQD